jgi:hypothetical protein
MAVVTHTWLSIHVITLEVVPGVMRPSPAVSLNRLARYNPFRQPVCRTSSRLASTIVGVSGRVYVPGEVLRPSRDGYTPDIFKAEYV